MLKIAFLFLIYDIINHEDIWYDFFSKDTQNRHSIYIHYKFPPKLKYFDSHKLDNCIATKWGDISLVNAQNLLLKKALEDPENEMFIFCSGACVPLKSFEHVYNSLDRKYSYFNMFANRECYPRCRTASLRVNRMYIQKASQWCILNRKHAQLITETDVYIHWFKETIGDEHCYVTYLNYLKLSSETARTFYAAENATTFTNWPNMRYRFETDTRGTLKTYKSITPTELVYLWRSKCLFGRKFALECDLRLLKQLHNSQPKEINTIVTKYINGLNIEDNRKKRAMNNNLIERESMRNGIARDNVATVDSSTTVKNNMNTKSTNVSAGVKSYYHYRRDFISNIALTRK